MVVGFKQFGIWLRASSFLCELSGCSVADNDSINIYLENLDQGRGGNWVPNLVSDCKVYGGGKGISLKKSIVVNIVGCLAYQTRGTAFSVTDYSCSVLISGCRTYQIQSDAVVVEDSHEINISSNIFCWHEGHGIVLNNVHWGTISANNVIDNGSINLVTQPFESELIRALEVDVRGEKYAHKFHMTPPENAVIDNKNGIVLTGETMGVTVSGNAVFNWQPAPHMDYGIIEHSTCSNNIISSNNINFSQKEGVRSRGKTH